MSKKCVICGSYAINVNHHGRKPNTDTDLCDVCYWRKRAGGFENNEQCKGVTPKIRPTIPAHLSVKFVEPKGEIRRIELEHDLLKRLTETICAAIEYMIEYGCSAIIIKHAQWENETDSKIYDELPEDVLKELKSICKVRGYKLSYITHSWGGGYLKLKSKWFFNKWVIYDKLS